MAHEIRAGEQLSLDVGGDPGKFVKAEFRMGGQLETFTTSLDRDEEVMITLTDGDGTVVARGYGWVKAVTIETIRATKATPFKGTKRKHSIKLGEHAPDYEED